MSCPSFWVSRRIAALRPFDFICLGAMDRPGVSFSAGGNLPAPPQVRRGFRLHCRSLEAELAHGLAVDDAVDRAVLGLHVELHGLDGLGPAGLGPDPLRAG